MYVVYCCLLLSSPEVQLQFLHRTLWAPEIGLHGVFHAHMTDVVVSPKDALFPTLYASGTIELCPSVALATKGDTRLARHWSNVWPVGVTCGNFQTTLVIVLVRERDRILAGTFGRRTEAKQRKMKWSNDWNRRWAATSGRCIPSAYWNAVAHSFVTVKCGVYFRIDFKILLGLFSAKGLLHREHTSLIMNLENWLARPYQLKAPYKAMRGHTYIS